MPIFEGQKLFAEYERLRSGVSEEGGASGIVVGVVLDRKKDEFVDPVFRDPGLYGKAFMKDATGGCGR